MELLQHQGWMAVFLAGGKFQPVINRAQTGTRRLRCDIGVFHGDFIWVLPASTLLQSHYRTINTPTG